MPSGVYVPKQDWVNDSQLSGEEILWRRIKKEWIRPPVDGSIFTISQQAFRTEEVSCYIASQTSVTDVLSNYPTDSLASVPVSFLRDELELIVVKDPQDTDPNPSHRLIGREDHKTVAKSTAKKIAIKAKWVVLKHPETGEILVPPTS
jgi:hypothetical protein